MILIVLNIIKSQQFSESIAQRVIILYTQIQKQLYKHYIRLSL